MEEISLNRIPPGNTTVYTYSIAVSPLAHFSSVTTVSVGIGLTGSTEFRTDIQMAPKGMGVFN